MTCEYKLEDTLHAIAECKQNIEELESDLKKQQKAFDKFIMKSERKTMKLEENIQSLTIEQNYLSEEIHKRDKHRPTLSLSLSMKELTSYDKELDKLERQFCHIKDILDQKKIELEYEYASYEGQKGVLRCTIDTLKAYIAIEQNKYDELVVSASFSL